MRLARDRIRGRRIFVKTSIKIRVALKWVLS